jgi:hypothetical protein
MNTGTIVALNPDGTPPPGVVPVMGTGFGIYVGEEAIASGAAGAVAGGVAGAGIGAAVGAPAGGIGALPGAVIGAGIGAFGGGLLGATAGMKFEGESEAMKSDIEKAAAQQAKTLEETQAMAEPYAEAGEAALQQQQALAGLLGPEAQQAAIAQLEASPQFQAAVAQGERAILQNASATGGLRGGNVQAMLAQFRPQLLSSIIDQQYARLAGLTGTGLTAVGAQMGLGGEIGAARAGGILGPAQLDYMEAQRRQQMMMAALSGGAQALPGIIGGLGAMPAAPAAGGVQTGGTSPAVYTSGPPVSQTGGPSAAMQNASIDYGIA